VIGQESSLVLNAKRAGSLAAGSWDSCYLVPHVIETDAVF